MKELGIIIPTYNRKKICIENLVSLQKQTLSRDSFSVTVIDDGSTDGTYQELCSLQKSLDYELSILRQKNQGQGVARNAGIEKTDACYLLFIGDDILPSHSLFLEKHLEALSKSDKKTAFLGHTTWHPDIPQTRFRTWLENGGPQFDYRALHNNEFTDFWHFYTSNISLPREALLHDAFDPHFFGYGWEDIELGYRLVTRQGFRIQYIEEAKAWHYHELHEKEVWARIPKMTVAANYFEQKHPEIQLTPKTWKKYLIACATAGFIPQVATYIKSEWGWYLRLKKEMQ